VRRLPSPVDGRSVKVVICVAGQELVDLATARIEAEVGALVEDLSQAQRDELSATASLIVAADAHRRGIDIFNVGPGVDHRPDRPPSLRARATRNSGRRPS
jgi:hypothetical protein